MNFIFISTEITCIVVTTMDQVRSVNTNYNTFLRTFLGLRICRPQELGDRYLLQQGSRTKRKQTLRNNREVLCSFVSFCYCLCSCFVLSFSIFMKALPFHWETRGLLSGENNNDLTQFLDFCTHRVLYISSIRTIEFASISPSVDVPSPSPHNPPLSFKWFSFSLCLERWWLPFGG